MAESSTVLSSPPVSQASHPPAPAPEHAHVLPHVPHPPVTTAPSVPVETIEPEVTDEGNDATNTNLEPDVSFYLHFNPGPEGTSKSIKKEILNEPPRITIVLKPIAHLAVMSMLDLASLALRMQCATCWSSMIDRFVRSQISEKTSLFSDIMKYRYIELILTTIAYLQI